MKQFPIAPIPAKLQFANIGGHIPRMPRPY